MSEVLLTCPRCQQPGFTVRGLRAHHCRANKRRRLSVAAIKNAERQAHSPQPSSLSPQVSPATPSPMSKDKPSKAIIPTVVVFEQSKLTATAQLTKFQAATIDMVEEVGRVEQVNVERRLGAGIALRIVKSSLPHGQFTTWLKKNVKGAGYTQCTYMMRAAEAFVEEMKIGKPDLLAITTGEIVLASETKGTPSRVQKAARKFIGELTWGELLMKHDIKADPKKKPKDEPAAEEPTPPKILTPEEQYEQSRDEIGGLIDRAENLFLKENRLSHLAGHPEEIAGVVAGLRALADKVETAAAPLLASK